MVTAFAQDSLGGLWFGHMYGLSYCFNGEWSGYRKDAGLPLWNSQDCIVSKQNVLWAACIGGVMSYDYSEWRVYDTTNGLPFYSANTVTQTSEGKILVADKGIATFENGKFVLDPETKEWWVHSLRSFDDIIVASTGIGAFLKRKNGPWKKVIEEDIRCTDSEMDQDGRIWIATTSKGIIVLDTTASILCNISVEEDLPCEYISDIAYSRKDDKMWVATGYGLASVKLFNKGETTVNRSLNYCRPIKPPSRITGVYDLRGRRIMNETEKPVLFNNSAGMYIIQHKKSEQNKRKMLVK